MEILNKKKANKLKVLFISDHPLVPSGCGTQSKYLIEGLLNTGNFKFVCLGGAIKHPDYTPQKIAPEKYGDDWIIYPVDGYGDKSIIRRMLISEKPDAIIIFTDPRFFVWLFEMEDEIRQNCPLIYWHVWDNDPIPDFNKAYYDSTSFIAALSLKTYGILQKLLPKDKYSYIPHALPSELFKPLPEEQVEQFKKEKFQHHANKKFLVFWNNRNARRKQTGDIVAAFSKFADVVGKENTSLMMHSNVFDPEGQNIIALAKKFNVENEMIISENRVSPEELNLIYNSVDCTINISSNEGFGLGTLESLYSGTPIILHMTGGLQFQIGDWWKDITDFSDQDEMTKIAKKKFNKKEGLWTGVPVFSASRSCTGSQQIPYIYDDRVNHSDVVNALVHLYKLGRKTRKENGLVYSKWAVETFNQQNIIKQFNDMLLEQCEKFKQNKEALNKAVFITL